MQIVSGADTSSRAAWARAGLAALTPAYRAGLLAHRGWQWARLGELRRPTVSIGNLVAGGTGKTPMVMDTVGLLRELGQRPAVLLRGYAVKHGSTPDSDEAEVLRNGLPADVPVVPNKSRKAAAVELLAGYPEVSCFVLDDGFQHRLVRRDLDVVLLDATRPFGFGHVLPRGLLREPLSALRRADVVLVTRSDAVDAAALDRLDEAVASVTGTPPLGRVVHAWSGLRVGAERRPLDRLAGLRVLAVSGIGNPAEFERQLREAGAEIAEPVRFNDHHAYRHAEVRALMGRAVEQKLDAVVTTEKDWVKWRRLGGRERIKLPVPVYRPVLGMRFVSGREAWEARVRAAVGA